MIFCIREVPTVSVRPLQGWSCSDRALISDLGPNFYSWPNSAQLQRRQQSKYDLKAHSLAVLWKRESENANVIGVVWQHPRVFDQAAESILQFFWKKILSKPPFVKLQDGRKEPAFQGKAETALYGNVTSCFSCSISIHVPLLQQTGI